MTAPWGPALDAEVAYRHEQLRAQFGRRHRVGRRHAPEATVSGGRTVSPVARPGAPVETVPRIPAQRPVTIEPAAATGDRAGRRAA